jgi:hypothetical protein
MSGSARYVTLLTGLPWLGTLFSAGQTPMSRLRLEHRLRQLEPEHARGLNELTGILHWINHDLTLKEGELIARAQAFEAEWGEGFLTDILRFRLEVRSTIAALRRRRHDENEAPAWPWGYGRWQRHIERHWNESGFRLQRAFPWIDEAERLIEQRDSLALQRLQLDLVWQHLIRISAGHEFDFEAVVIYVLRWDLIARWSAYQGERAALRFDQLVETGLGDYHRLFPELPGLASTSGTAAA